MSSVLEAPPAAEVPEHLVEVGELDRRLYIGGSNAAALLGLDPYGKTPLSIYLAKRGELETGAPDPERELFLKRRKRWEEPIVAMLREEYDGEIVAVNRRFVEREYEFLGGEIDFEWRDADGTIQNGEIKTVSPFAFNERGGWGEAGTDEIPIHYYCQVIHGLGVTRRRTCIVAALAGLDTMVFYRVDRDEEAIEKLRAAEISFWRDNVLAGVPPEPITMEDVKRIWARRNGRPVEIDAETFEKISDLRRLRAELASNEETEKETALAIAKAVCKAWNVPEGEDPPADNAVLTFGGERVVTWAKGSGAYLDQKRLALEHPEIVREYKVPTAFRVFRFPKSK